MIGSNRNISTRSREMVLYKITFAFFQQCRKLARKRFMYEWYRLPRETILGLVLVISRSSIVTRSLLANWSDIHRNFW